MTPAPRLAAVSTTVKVAVLVLLALAVVDPDLGGLKSKGLGVRAVVYPLGLVVLPLLVAVVRRWRPQLRLNPAADLLCALPILVDLLGNRLDLFDRVWWWDDAMHLTMHGVMTAGRAAAVLGPAERRARVDHDRGHPGGRLRRAERAALGAR